MTEQLNPEWLSAWSGYMESIDAEFEQYETSIHQDGFGAGWTLGQEAARPDRDAAALRSALQLVRTGLLMIGSVEAKGGKQRADEYRSQMIREIDAALAAQDRTAPAERRGGEAT